MRAESPQQTISAPSSRAYLSYNINRELSTCPGKIYEYITARLRIGALMRRAERAQSERARRDDISHRGGEFVGMVIHHHRFRTLENGLDKSQKSVCKLRVRFDGI